MTVVSRRSDCCVFQLVAHGRTKSLGTARKINYGGCFRPNLVSVSSAMDGYSMLQNDSLPIFIFGEYVFCFLRDTLHWILCLTVILSLRNPKYTINTNNHSPFWKWILLFKKKKKELHHATFLKVSLRNYNIYMGDVSVILIFQNLIP